MGLNRTVLNTPDQRGFSTALTVERAFIVCPRDLSRVSRRGGRHAADPIAVSPAVTHALSEPGSLVRFASLSILGLDASTLIVSSHDPLATGAVFHAPTDRAGVAPAFHGVAP